LVDSGQLTRNTRHINSQKNHPKTIEKAIRKAIEEKFVPRSKALWPAE
jgi:hypothetical protein